MKFISIGPWLVSIGGDNLKIMIISTIGIYDFDIHIVHEYWLQIFLLNSFEKKMRK